uniref:Uncharacterized protein n=1 Tax=Noctiluca scintillans TaxID=2966 RepID=A0A7S1FAF7_NOCSC|mmetsp:Transcript_47937/g.126942  ORF Transcript_47937/g.126942 Transcript_47937/m.126942 type:complete len:224 (+) Transcript_47937:81-752(+)
MSSRVQLQVAGVPRCAPSKDSRLHSTLDGHVAVRRPPASGSGLTRPPCTSDNLLNRNVESPARPKASRRSDKVHGCTPDGLKARVSKDVERHVTPSLRRHTDKSRTVASSSVGGPQRFQSGPSPRGQVTPGVSSTPPRPKGSHNFSPTSSHVAAPEAEDTAEDQPRVALTRKLATRLLADLLDAYRTLAVDEARRTVGRNWGFADVNEMTACIELQANASFTR